MVAQYYYIWCKGSLHCVSVEAAEGNTLDVHFRCMVVMLVTAPRSQNSPGE
jgi:hypothetical protein